MLNQCCDCAMHAINVVVACPAGVFHTAVHNGVDFPHMRCGRGGVDRAGTLGLPPPCRAPPQTAFSVAAAPAHRGEGLRGLPPAAGRSARTEDVQPDSELLLASVAHNRRRQLLMQLVTGDAENQRGDGRPSAPAALLSGSFSPLVMQREGTLQTLGPKTPYPIPRSVRVG